MSCFIHIPDLLKQTYLHTEVQGFVFSHTIKISTNLYACGNLNFSLQGLGSMLFTASLFFVTSYFSFLITLITVTPGGRDNHGCSQKLSQTFISPGCWAVPVSQPRVPRISPGQLRCCHGTGQGSSQAGPYKSLWDRAKKVFISEPPLLVYPQTFP